MANRIGLIALLIAVAVAGCREHPGDEPDAAMSGGGGELDASVSDGGGAFDAGCTAGQIANGQLCVPQAIVVPSTDGPLSQTYAVAIAGQGSENIGAVSISDNVGTIEIAEETLQAVSYEQIPFPASGDTLYQILAVSTDYWAVAWAYCSAGSLSYVWYETTDGDSGVSETASGTCSATEQTPDSLVMLPASSQPPPAVTSGFSVTGADLHFDGVHLGTMQVGADTWQFSPYTSVDCSTGCGTPGWYELHSLIWNPAGTEACYGIYYLIQGMPDQVTLDYVICLPGLNDLLGGGVFAATYTTP